MVIKVEQDMQQLMTIGVHHSHTASCTDLGLLVPTKYTQAAGKPLIVWLSMICSFWKTLQD